MSRVILLMLLIAVIVGLATYLAYRYLDAVEQRRHEERMHRDELTEKLVDQAEHEYEQRRP